MAAVGEELQNVVEIAEPMLQQDSENTQALSIVESVCTMTDIQAQVNRENLHLNNKILNDKLVPELLKNEKQKRTLKMMLLIGVFAFIIAQLVVMSVFVGHVVYALTNNAVSINENLSIEMMSFMRFYITATLCEFIAMMFFIVRYVFDKSIFELVKLFKSNDTDSDTADINKTTDAPQV